MEDAVEQCKIDHTRELDDLNKNQKKRAELEINNTSGLQDQTDESDTQIVQRLKLEIKQLHVSIDIYQSDLHQQ